MNNITITTSNLPTNVDDLAKFALIGREKLVAVRAEIRAIDKVGLAQEVRDQKLREAQDISEAVLDAEVRIGELTAAMPKKAGRPSENSANPRQNFPTKADALDSAGINHRRASEYERMAAHPEAVARAKAQAREAGDILSRAKVLQEVGKDVRAAEKAARVEQASSNGISVDIFSTDNKYRVIYADPPWQYNDKQDTDYYGGAEKHYGTMPLSAIADLPIERIVEKNAVLFLWVTNPLIFDSQKIIEAWGFVYKSMFIWDKVRTGMGHYNSVRHEMLLICTRGSCTPDTKRMFDSVQSIERTENHSEKPQQFREIIDTLYVGKKIELFARQPHDDWDVWGNEV